MRCNEILYVEELERRAIARNLMRSRNEIVWRKGERRGVQDLADVAGGFWALVVVKECDAGHDVKKHHAAKHSERLARERRREEPGCRKTSH